MFLDKFFRNENITAQAPAGLMTDITDTDEFKERLGVKCKAKTLVELIKYLDTLPEQSWNMNKIFRSNSGKIRTVGIYDSFPTYEDAAQLFEKFGGGKYTVLCISPKRTKVGYYEFEGEDKEPEEDEESARTKRFKLKYKPKDFKEAVLLQRLEEGDEQVIQKITDAELSRQGIVKSEDDACTIQQPGVGLKEHFDAIEELKDELHKKDMQIIEEKFKKGEKSSGWDAFMRMLETDTGKELGKEALDTLKEIFKTAGSGKEEAEVEKFEDFKDKSLTPAKEQVKKEKPRRDFTPLKIMCKFIENDGDPSAYLENMSIAYPEHPFCQTLIVCETTDQFLSKLKPLEQKLPILFGDKGKAWLEELFTIIKEFKNGESGHEPTTETGNKADTEEEFNSDADALQKNQKVESV